MPNPKRKGRATRNYVTQRQVRGGRFTPAANPPDVDFQPWQHITLVAVKKGDFECKVIDIQSLLRSQLDPTSHGFNQTTTGEDRFMVQIHLLSVTSWNLSGRTIALSVEDFSESGSAAGGRDQLCGLVDTGTGQHIPRVGYRLPIALAQQVLRADDKQGKDVLFFVQGRAEDQIYTYISVKYKFDGPARIPKFDFGTEIQQVVDRMDRLNATSQQIVDAQPSTVNEIVKEGIIAASYVLPVAGVSTDHTYTRQLDKMDAILKLLVSLVPQTSRDLTESRTRDNNQFIRPEADLESEVSFLGSDPNDEDGDSAH